MLAGALVAALTRLEILKIYLPEICGATIYMAKHLPVGQGHITYTHP